jgi:hypothetical protein
MFIYYNLTDITLIEVVRMKKRYLLISLLFIFLLISPVIVQSADLGDLITKDGMIEKDTPEKDPLPPTKPKDDQPPEEPAMGQLLILTHPHDLVYEGTTLFVWVFDSKKNRVSNAEVVFSFDPATTYYSENGRVSIVTPYVSYPLDISISASFQGYEDAGPYSIQILPQPTDTDRASLRPSALPIPFY